MKLWQKSLQHLQQRFLSLQGNTAPLSTILGEITYPRQSKNDDRKEHGFNSYKGAILIAGFGSYYRSPRSRFSLDGRRLFTNKPWYDGAGQPMLNSAGEAFDFIPGAQRTITFYGNYDLFESFEQLGEEAATCIESIKHLIGLVTPESLAGGIPKNRFLNWIFILFDLAWKKFPGSLLHANREVWNGDPNLSFSIPEDCIEHIPEIIKTRGSGPYCTWLENISTTPQQIHSSLDDVMAASVAAINILLTSSPRVTQSRANPSKTLAVLFTDIVGSTELINQLHDAQMFTILGCHFKRAAECCAQHSGELIKTLGDGIIAVFDTAAHALDAAGDLARNPGNQEIKLRFGISVGPMIKHDGDVSGRPAHLCSRLIGVAKSWEVVVCARAKDDIDQQGFQEHTRLAWTSEHSILKGFDKSIVIWRAGLHPQPNLS